MNINTNNTYKTTNSNKMKTFSDNNSKVSKLTLLDNFLYGKEFLNSENYKNNKKNGNIEINNQNDENIIQKKNSKMSKSVNSLNLNDNSNYNYNLDDENKNENMGSNDNVIVRRRTKKKRYRGEPEKNRINNSNNKNEPIDFMKEYGSYDDCTLNIPKDLKCGCTGNLDEGCFIF